MDKRQFSGFIQVRNYGESDDVLFVGDSDEPFAEVLDFCHRKNITARYWLSANKCTQEEASNNFQLQVMGVAESNFCERYSELTGYLWTDEYLKVGGHDLIERLKTADGYFLNLEIEIHDEQKKQVDNRAPRSTIKPRTIAQSIRRSNDPYRASITSFIRREVIRSDDGQSDKKIFHFEDGSFLTFMVSYAAIEDGCA